MTWDYRNVIVKTLCSFSVPTIGASFTHGSRFWTSVAGRVFRTTKLKLKFPEAVHYKKCWL
jgi:hypothetical protein